MTLRLDCSSPEWNYKWQHRKTDPKKPVAQRITQNDRLLDGILRQMVADGTVRLKVFIEDVPHSRRIPGEGDHSQRIIGTDTFDSRFTADLGNDVVEILALTIDHGALDGALDPPGEPKHMSLGQVDEALVLSDDILMGKDAQDDEQ